MHSSHPKLVNKVLKNILRNKSFKWWFYQRLWRVWDVIQVSLPQLHRGWQKTQAPGPEVKAFVTHGRAGSRRFRFALVLLAPGAEEPKQRQPQMHPAHSVGLGNPSLTQGLLEHLPNICPQGKHYLYYPVRKKTTQHTISHLGRRKVLPLPPKAVS